MKLNNYNYDFRYYITKDAVKGINFIKIYKLSRDLIDWLYTVDLFFCKSTGWYISLYKFPFVESDKKTIYIPNFEIDINNPVSTILSNDDEIIVSLSLKEFKEFVDNYLNYTYGEKPRKDSHEKPPIGVKPEKLHEEHRIKELSRAIYEYCQSNRIDVVEKWIFELHSRVTNYNLKYNEQLDKNIEYDSEGKGNTLSSSEGMGDY